MGRVADAEAVISGLPNEEPLLLELLTTHPHPSVRYAAAEALRTAGTAAAIPVLEQRSQVETDKGVQGRIREALKTLRHKMRVP